jgi:hypothetical protein
MDVQEMAPNKVAFSYTCPQTTRTRNVANTGFEQKSHYIHTHYPKGSLVNMIIHPFILFHSQYNNLTSVFHNDLKACKEDEIIFRVRLLDMDYSNTHHVINRLKKLSVFS